MFFIAIIKMNNIRKKFGKFTALDGIDLEVEKGDIYGFIGPNGAGKTTAIRVLLGILKASSGSATVFDQDVWKDAVQIHKRLAYVAGDVNLWPNLTGGEVIDLFLKLGGSKDRKRRDDLVEIFQLDPSKKCRTYSKGNRQKVALIAAFASDADLYILDEPTSGLDPLMENIFQKCVRHARDQGKTILLSSHILSEVERLCNKVSIIRQGQIIESGSLDQLRHLTRTRMEVQSKKPIESLDKIQGIHDLEVRDRSLYFQVDSEEMDDVIRYISQFGIEKLESYPPTLEDLFMRHYKGEDGGK